MELGGSKRSNRLILVALIVAAGWLVQRAGVDVPSLLSDNHSAPSVDARIEPSSDPHPAEDAQDRILRAIANRESGFMVTVEARVVKRLSDDRDGSRHQRFLIQLDAGPTLLVAHNIDLADRVVIAEGDRVRVRGQYEWNDKGGLLHWTHHDPDGDHPGGWIEARGRRVE